MKRLWHGYVAWIEARSKLTQAVMIAVLVLILILLFSK